MSVLNQNKMSAPVKGRFAPSPSGRMHLGNVFTALISWLSTRKSGGKWLLRIEDLDPQRSKYEYARLIEDDLHWLGLDWDEGGLDCRGSAGPYCQSERNDFYLQYFEKIAAKGITYPCHCKRADIMATQAPHESDGRIVYAGTCRPALRPPFPTSASSLPAATRLYVPDSYITFDDVVYGQQSVNLTRHCGDFVIRRADSAWAYQLAVVIDDALMGISEVVRGCDLLLSTAQQLYLYELLGFTPPHFAHLPLVSNEAGQRLSKRDGAMNMEYLRKHHNPAAIIGMAAYLAGLCDSPAPVTADELVDSFSWGKIPSVQAVTIPTGEPKGQKIEI